MLICPGSAANYDQSRKRTQYDNFHGALHQEVVGVIAYSTNLLLIVSEPHRGVQPISEFSQNLVLAGLERVTETYGVIATSTVPTQAFFIDGLDDRIRPDSNATRTGPEWLA